MKINIVPKFNTSNLNKVFQASAEKMIEKAKHRFIDIGESFKKYAKENKGFEDHTYNLVSSIGFGVAFQGELIHVDFDGKGAEGVEKGEKLVTELASKCSNMTLICVAGENYALAVESKGRDVITGSSQVVEGLLKRLIL
ncbi:Uncharacterised protein [Sphingobacterium multivorum]|uniref:hypothetical protein n=1 Tax=Sphingobacterium multivorum TaxID=28454 RepID=UPI000E05A497|nr:hypothetical protein [Sphingobacterium multivorum]QQT43354.1 hypothetical protein I6J00_16540 [Sphingobacterium multivorum]SUI98467.1 Uncharacterised protein [Sphingobacterium multivorum]